MATQNPPEKHNEPTLTTRLESKISQTLTILYTDLPPWQRDNIHIHSGYRPASNSYRTSLASLTHLHNETVNIYTHFVGALLALCTGVYAYGTLRPRYEMATHQDVGVFACFFGGAVGCLGMSAAYHTISNHSDLVAGWGNKLDYLG
jgi:adiponectin receptor